MIKNKILLFLQKHSKGVIALLVALSILISLVGAVPIVLLIRDLTAEKKPAATTVPTTSSVYYTIPTTDEQIKAAIVTLTERLEKTKDDSSLYTQRAALYYHLEEYDKAIADYTSALEIYPHPHNYYLRAVVYSVSGDDRNAYLDLSKALKDKPTEADYLSLMADTCVALKKHKKARECLELLLETDKKNALLSTLAGDACVNLEDFSAAATHYANAIINYTEETEKAGIAKATLYSAYANALKMTEKYADAAVAYGQSLEMKEAKELYYQRGFCLLQIAKYTEAIADFTKCIELGYEVATAKFQRGLCYYVTEKYEEAIADFKDYEAALPDKSDASLYLGLCQQALKQYEAAIASFEKSIAAEISVGDCSFNIGNCYYNLGKFEEAVPFYTTAIEKNTQLYPALLNRGNAYVKLNKYNEAKEDLKRVIDECTDADLVKSAQASYDPIKNITIITKK